MTGRLYDLGPSGPEEESPGADRPPVSPGLNPSRRFAPCRSSSAKIPSSSSLNVPASCSVRPNALRVLSWTPLIFLARGEVVMSSGETKALSKFDGSYRRGTSPLRPDRDDMREASLGSRCRALWGGASRGADDCIQEGSGCALAAIDASAPNDSGSITSG